MNHEEVVSNLVDYGYYILYENLEIKYLGYSTICEFDIVGLNFIIDVKTTKFHNSSNKTINFLQAYRLLPEGYKYFVYSPLFTEDEIEELKEIYTSPSFIFINDLKKIKEYISPVKNMECNTTRDLANLLRITDDEISKINKIYVPYSIYRTYYDSIIRLRNVHDDLLLTRKSSKIDSLIEENKIVFDKSHLENVYPFSSGDKYKNSCKLHIKSLDKIVLNQAYYNVDFKK